MGESAVIVVLQLRVGATLQVGALREGEVLLLGHPLPVKVGLSRDQEMWGRKPSPGQKRTIRPTVDLQRSGPCPKVITGKENPFFLVRQGLF